MPSQFDLSPEKHSTSLVPSALPVVMSLNGPEDEPSTALGDSTLYGLEMVPAAYCAHGYCVPFLPAKSPLLETSIG